MPQLVTLIYLQINNLEFTLNNYKQSDIYTD